MAPERLGKEDSSRNWTNSHRDNCRAVRDRLVELNPGYNVFIYWVSWGSISSENLRPDEPDKLCFTDNNYEKVDSEYRFQRTTRPKVQWDNWMGQLRSRLGARCSQLYLSSLALPATHNSHALSKNISYTGWSAILNLPGLHGHAATYAECQTHTVKEQLDMGVRCFDFRVGPGLKLRHGLVELTGHLEDVVKIMDDWLNSHDQETIMFQAKWDMEPYSDENRDNTVAEVAELLKKYPRAQAHLTEVPRLWDCVGKMVLYNDNNRGPWCPQGWEGPSFQSQASTDVLKHCEGAYHRLGSILPQLDVTDKKFYNVWCCAESLSSLSVFGKAGDRLGTFKWDVARPIAFAKQLKDKEQLLWWLANHRGGTQNSGRKARLGRINLDFVDYKWANEIVLWNFDDSFL